MFCFCLEVQSFRSGVLFSNWPASERKTRPPALPPAHPQGSSLLRRLAGILLLLLHITCEEEFATQQNSTFFPFFSRSLLAAGRSTDLRRPHSDRMCREAVLKSTDRRLLC